MDILHNRLVKSIIDSLCMDKSVSVMEIKKETY